MFQDNLQRRIENWSIYFQGGVRRGVIIFSIVCLILLAPLYFLGIFISSVWFSLPINAERFDTTQYFAPKFITENPIGISTTQVVDLKDGSKELYLTLDNKSNPQIGFYPFVYNLQVLDANGAALSNERRSTYILPGDIAYIVYNSPNGQANRLVLSRDQNSTVPVYYNPQSRRFRNPQLRITNENFQIRTFTNDMTVRFTIRNEDQVNIGRVNILFTIRDTRESVVGIGDFVVENLRAGEQRDINIPYTQPLQREPRFVNIITQVNYLDADNLKLR